MTHVLLVLVLPAALAGNVAAQSLGDLARQEEARRKAIQSSGKVYTNDSVKSDGAPAPPPAPAPTPAATATTPAAGQQQPPATAPEDAKKDEKYWQQRLQAERDALSRAQIFAEALQSRINALSTEFVNRDDPAQRQVISTDRQKAIAELERVRTEIAQHTKAIAAIQEEARKAGVPAGWYR